MYYLCRILCVFVGHVCNVALVVEHTPIAKVFH